MGGRSSRKDLSTSPHGRCRLGRLDAVLHVTGRYVEFDFAPATGNVYNYVYTGASNPQSFTNGVRTPIWESRTLDLGPALRTETEVRPDGGDLQLLARGKAG